jgi:GNAT superfamily N-acetyltransferase
MTAGPFQIRRAEVTDTALLARLRYDFRSGRGTALEDQRTFLLRCEQWIRERLGSGSHWRCWIAEREGATAGTVWLGWIEKIPNPVAELEWHGYITNLYVLPEFRGQRLGAALLETALGACRERGVDAVILWPTPLSRTLYARYGFAARDDIMELRSAGLPDHPAPARPGPGGPW